MGRPECARATPAAAASVPSLQHPAESGCLLFNVMVLLARRPAAGRCGGPWKEGSMLTPEDPQVVLTHQQPRAICQSLVHLHACWARGPSPGSVEDEPPTLTSPAAPRAH